MDHDLVFIIFWVSLVFGIVGISFAMVLSDRYKFKNAEEIIKKLDYIAEKLIDQKNR